MLLSINIVPESVQQFLTTKQIQGRLIHKVLNVTSLYNFLWQQTAKIVSISCSLSREYHKSVHLSIRFQIWISDLAENYASVA